MVLVEVVLLEANQELAWFSERQQQETDDSLIW